MDNNAFYAAAARIPAQVTKSFKHCDLCGSTPCRCPEEQVFRFFADEADKCPRVCENCGGEIESEHPDENLCDACLERSQCASHFEARYMEPRRERR